ncbi:hypothetical protein [Stenotrophomonas mori]|uniref:Type IV pilus biogenesis protein PilP n=1 Tax=Stenotrophomonas mori TaxID=2871096 RepID=A0ABT0SIJ1_9GAMM|nr:hypothetical protein [Stenotrophomonas mori]MCL7715157.1 hypothetical protein [Stenotrophomonas mori]
MKMKFTAAFALAIWLAVTAWLATMVIVKPAVLHLGNNAEETAAMAQLRGAIGHNHQLQARLAELRRPDALGDGQPLLALPSTPASGATGPGLRVDSTAAPAAHSVSIVLDTGGRRSAVIDGHHVRAGTRLGDGARVAAIGADWVRIENSDGTRKVHTVASPFHPAAASGDER